MELADFQLILICCGNHSLTQSFRLFHSPLRNGTRHHFFESFNIFVWAAGVPATHLHTNCLSDGLANEITRLI